MRFIAASVLVIGLWVTRALATDPPPPMDFMPKGVTKIVQWTIDPLDSNQGWALSTDSLQFNPGLKTGQQWSVKFTRRTYTRVRGTDPGPIEFIKVLPSSKKRGNLFLMVGSESGRSQIFFTPDYGDTWKYLGSRDRSGGKAFAGSTGGPPMGGGDGPVDLSNLGSESPGTPSSTTTGAPPTSAPLFKVYFDLLVTSRPGISPLSFDNYHTIVLVDFIPKPGILFSFDLNPNPRFYQLEYDLSDRFTLLAGRILIPFDDMSPHNRFGGYLNNSRTVQPNAPAFLPDVWADLGIGFRYKLLEVSNLTVLTHLYIVNGFQDGGSDPVTPGAPYPNFGALPFPDNNGDKAIGARIQTDFFQVLTFVFSFYTGSWTKSPQPSSRLTILGAHARVRPTSLTQIRVGYIYFSVDLPAGSALPSFQRGGLYAEIRQKLKQNWYALVETGVLQTDDRVIDAGDQLMVGGRFGYQTPIFDISLQYRHDLKVVTGKLNRDYTAARFSLSL